MTSFVASLQKLRPCTSVVYAVRVFVLRSELRRSQRHDLECAHRCVRTRVRQSRLRRFQSWSCGSSVAALRGKKAAQFAFQLADFVRQARALTHFFNNFHAVLSKYLSRASARSKTACVMFSLSCSRSDFDDVSYFSRLY